MQNQWPKPFVISWPVTLSNGSLRASHSCSYGDSGLADGTKRIPFPSLLTFKAGQLASSARFFIYGLWLLPIEKQEVTDNLNTRWRWVASFKLRCFAYLRGRSPRYPTAMRLGWPLVRCPCCKVKKVKCTLVQALRLCTDRTAHRWNRGIALLFLDHGTRRGWGVSVTPRSLFTCGKDPVPIVQEAGWAPGPVRTGAENLAPTGIRSPDRPARSQSLCPLSYPSPLSML